MLHIVCLLYVKVWTADVCSITNAVHIHVTQDGCTALHLAAQMGHEDVVELLLEAKADPQVKTEVIKVTSVLYGTPGKNRVDCEVHLANTTTVLAVLNVFFCSD